MAVERKGDIAYVGDRKAGVAVSFSGGNKLKKAKQEPDSTTIKAEGPENTSGDIAYWGQNNDYPQKILKALEQSGVGGSALRLRQMAHYGNGIVYFKEAIENNKRVKTLISKEQLSDNQRDFERNNNMKRFHKELIADLETFSIAFPEYILSADYKTITKVKRQQAAFCRFGQMNEKAVIEEVFISSKWEDNPTKESEYVTPVNYLSPHMTPKEVLEHCKQKGIRKFIRPIMLPLMSESYYPKTGWHALYKNGWFDVVASIPDLKKSIFENQTVILYHIEIAVDYFYHKYGQEKWDAFTAKEQDQKRQELLDEIDERLTGKSNTHKSLLTLIYKNDAGEYEPGVKVTAVDNKYKDGAYLPEASAGNSEILFAMQVDPTIIGAGVPGGKMGGGGGSDKREAYTILCSLMKSPREVCLEPWEFIRDYNEWDPDLEAGFENTVLTTLDKNPTGTQNTIST